MTSPANLVAAAVEKALAGQSDEEQKYISASSLAHGCMQLVAREVQGIPKPELEPKVKRVLEVGRDGHRRIERYLRGISLASEVLFKDDEHRIKGYCDSLLFIPKSLSEEHSGFYAVEIKTLGSMTFERVSSEGPREDHRRQCIIYIWGLRGHYGLPVRGGIVLYENRDTLDHRVFDIEYDEGEMESLLARVDAMWEALGRGQLPEDHLPLGHWYHAYCPYLDICPAGQDAIRYQREHRKGIPDEVLARIIGERIVRKRREGNKKKKERSLAELCEVLGWE